MGPAKISPSAWSPSGRLRKQRFLTIVEEIAERKRAEQAPEKRGRFRDFLSGSCRHAQTGRWEMVATERSVLEILATYKTNCAERRLRCDTSRRPPGVSPQSAGFLQEISPWSTEKRYIHKEGAIVWARCVSLVRDQDNRPQYFISVDDNTERYRRARSSG